MLIPFSDIEAGARVWIYQSVRPIAEQELSKIRADLTAFCERWATHGQPMKCSFDVLHNQFIVLAADEAHLAASGCSIDDSVRVIKQIEEQFNLGLFNRNFVAFLISGRVELFELRTLKEKFLSGALKSDTPAFNNLISTKGQLSNDWLVPASRSWLKRYIASAAIAS